MGGEGGQQGSQPARDTLFCHATPLLTTHMLQPTINRVRSPSKPSRGAGFAPASPMGGAASPSRRAAPGASAADDALVWMAESAPLMDLTSGIRAARTPRLLALGGGGGGGAAAAAAAAAGRRPSTGESDDRGGEGVVVDVAFFPWVRRGGGGQRSVASPG